MIKKYFLLLCLVFTIYQSSHAQSGLDILQASFAKCKSIKQGYFNVNHKIKVEGIKDTIIENIKYQFQRLDNDSLFKNKFRSQLSYKLGLTYDYMYTGDELISLNCRDSSGTITSKKLWAKDMQFYYVFHDYYGPFTSRYDSPFSNYLDTIDIRYKIQLEADEKIGNYSCYRIKVIETWVDDTLDAETYLPTEKVFWINKADSILVQYSVLRSDIAGNDTIYNFEIKRLENYFLNQKVNYLSINIDSIPSYYTLKDYAPQKFEKQLPLNSLAPDWKLISLDGDSVSLKSLRGKVVLLDFFFKSCVPCIKAFPFLENLVDKYKSKGLIVVGIDPFDESSQEFKDFVIKRGINYKVLVDAIDVMEAYSVYSYPSFFLINKKGKIVYIKIDYDEEWEKNLEAAILKYL